MLFGKHINKYYLKHAPILLLGVAVLIAIDYIQLIVPRLYQMVINGINDGFVVDADGITHEFNMDFLLDEICLPLIFIILCMVIGRFLWRICFFGTAIKVETDLRGRMFDHCKDLLSSFIRKTRSATLCLCSQTTSKLFRTVSARAF